MPRSILGVGNEQPIILDGADVNMDIDADLVPEIRCASLVRSLCRTLLASCKAVGAIMPTYTWE